MSSSSDESINLTPDFVIQEAQIANNSLLPAKSQEKYLNTYNDFLKWKEDKNAGSFSENVLLAYFNELAKKYKPSTLWCLYSMIRSTMRCKNDIDIKSYSKLIAFLKRQNDGFKSKKSKVLKSNDIEKFLNEAPDNKYLATKVALIFGVTGACRREELAKITVEDIENHGEMLLVKIPNTKTKIARSFIIHGQFYNIVKKYETLRSNKGKSNRFFQNFTNGKCTAQCIGVNKFGGMPKEIAVFLGLPEPHLYTGHSFRRTSATLLAESGADITTLKRHGGWKSNTVAESYVEGSIENKKKISAQITQSVNLNTIPCPDTINIEPAAKRSKTEPIPSTSRGADHPPTPPSCSSKEILHEHTLSQTIQFAGKPMTFNFENCTNITFNFNS